MRVSCEITYPQPVDDRARVRKMVLTTVLFDKGNPVVVIDRSASLDPVVEPLAARCKAFRVLMEDTIVDVLTWRDKYSEENFIYSMNGEWKSRESVEQLARDLLDLPHSLEEANERFSHWSR